MKTLKAQKQYNKVGLYSEDRVIMRHKCTVYVSHAYFKAQTNLLIL